MSEEGQTTNEATEVEDTGTTNDSSVEGQNQRPQATSDSDSAPEEESSQTPSDQESLTSELAIPDQDLLKAMNQDLLELLDKQATGNQTLDKIQKDIEEFKKNNLLETKSVIHHLIQFYDTFVLLEPQLDDIKKIFESPGSQLDTISEHLESVKTWLKSVPTDEQKGGIFKKRKESARQSVEPVKKLVESLETLKTSLSQTDTEASDESAQSQEETEDRSSLLFQANTEMTNELSRFRANLENARYEFEGVLERIADVTPYKADPLDKFDRKIHRAVDTRSTDDPDKDRKVVESHKVGFYRGAEKLFRAEEVTIYRHIPPPDETEGTGSQESIDVDAPEGTSNGNSTSESKASVDEKLINEKGDETNE